MTRLLLLAPPGADKGTAPEAVTTEILGPLSDLDVIGSST
jgi:hypothetical protein